MEKKLGQELAFPYEEVLTQYSGAGAPQKWNLHTGMSKRFYAACAAMQGLCAAQDVRNYGINGEWVAKVAFKLADELLKQEQEAGDGKND